MWCVAKSKPQKELWLQASLTQLGVEIYFPRIIAKRRGGRLMEPLFPTYLFCRFDTDHSPWQAVRWTPGLSYFLGAEGYPTQLSDDLVAHVRRRVEAWNGAGQNPFQLRPGQRVRIQVGPFSAFDAIFERYVDSRQRCRVLIQALGRQTSVELDQRSLGLASSPL